MEELSILELASKGGWIMIILAVLSLIAVYIFVERFLAIRSAGKDDKLFMDRIRDYMKNNDVKSAINYCRNTNTAAARMIERGISRIGKPAQEIQTAIENTGNLEIATMEKRLPVLATIAGGAPMIGFLGTVIGMVEAFWQMSNAGKPGSTYLTYQEVAEEIVAGCVDIAGEVADLKMGNPYISSTLEQRDYIESPYSCTSTEDFADNIRSIQHSYCGALAGDHSVSNYVNRQNPELDAKVHKAIEEAIAAIEAIDDFENTAKGNPQVKAAIEKVSALEQVLDDEVLPLLSK